MSIVGCVRNSCGEEKELLKGGQRPRNQVIDWRRNNVVVQLTERKVLG